MLPGSKPINVSGNYQDRENRSEGKTLESLEEAQTATGTLSDNPLSIDQGFFQSVIEFNSSMISRNRCWRRS
jgi:hypothetical protein